MKSKNNLIVTKLRKTLLITALALCPFVASQSSLAQSTATGSLTDTVSGMSTFSITSNQTFQLTLMVTTNFLSSGCTYFLQSNNGNGFFQLTARDMSMSPYPDPTTSDSTAFGGMAGLLNPVNDFDLGATNNGSDTDPAGMYTLGILTVNALNVPAGQYTIFLDNRSIITDRTNGGFEDVPFSAVATINVVPEPASVALAVMGGALLLVVVYRKRAVRA